jgi:hypothetical protein
MNNNIATFDYLGITPRDYDQIPQDLIILAQTIDDITDKLSGKMGSMAANLRVMDLGGRFMNILAQNLVMIPRFKSRIEMALKKASDKKIYQD